MPITIEEASSGNLATLFDGRHAQSRTWALMINGNELKALEEKSQRIKVALEDMMTAAIQGELWPPTPIDMEADPIG